MADFFSQRFSAIVLEPFEWTHGAPTERDFAPSVRDVLGMLYRADVPSSARKGGRGSLLVRAALTSLSKRSAPEYEAFVEKGRTCDAVPENDTKQLLEIFQLLDESCANSTFQSELRKCFEVEPSAQLCFEMCQKLYSRTTTTAAPVEHIALGTLVLMAQQSMAFAAESLNSEVAAKRHRNATFLCSVRELDSTTPLRGSARVMRAFTKYLDTYREKATATSSRKKITVVRHQKHRGSSRTGRSRRRRCSRSPTPPRKRHQGSRDRHEDRRDKKRSRLVGPDDGSAALAVLHEAARKHEARSESGAALRQDLQLVTRSLQALWDPERRVQEIKERWRDVTALVPDLALSLPPSSSEAVEIVGHVLSSLPRVLKMAAKKAEELEKAEREPRASPPEVRAYQFLTSESGFLCELKKLGVLTMQEASSGAAAVDPPVLRKVAEIKQRLADGKDVRNDLVLSIAAAARAQFGTSALRDAAKRKLDDELRKAGAAAAEVLGAEAADKAVEAARATYASRSLVPPQEAAWKEAAELMAHVLEERQQQKSQTEAATTTQAAVSDSESSSSSSSD